ncbi:MAG: hypothetical protein ACYC61_25900 [Isosphaeraceae bacterium]
MPLLRDVAAACGSVVLLALVAAAPRGNAQEIKLADCPPAARKALEVEAPGGRITTVRKEQDGDEAIYWTDATIEGKTYAIGVLGDGTLVEMNLAVDGAEVPLDRCPAAVQAAFRREAMGEKVEGVGKDMKYGTTVYETVVHHSGRAYELVVAEDGMLVEKVLVIDDEELPLDRCPAAVQAALRHHARGGAISEVTRSAGILHPTYEAEVQLKDRIYLIEVAENGRLISKSLEAGEE